MNLNQKQSKLHKGISYNKKIYDLKYKNYKKSYKVKNGFSYTSENNKKFLSLNELKKIIKQYQSS